MHIDVVYAVNIRPGDIVAGDVVPDAPTRPVHPTHRAMTVHHVLPVRVNGERFDRYVMVFDHDSGSAMRSAARKSSEQLLVIRTQS